MPTSTEKGLPVRLLTWLVRDPQGFEHRVLKDSGFFFGHENLVHGVEPKADRLYVESHLLISMDQHPDMGEWAGFSWIAE